MPPGWADPSALIGRIYKRMEGERALGQIKLLRLLPITLSNTATVLSRSFFLSLFLMYKLQQQAS